MEGIGLSWLKYTLKRLLMLIPVIICVTFILYVILSFAPGNVAWQILGEDATQEQIAQLEAEMGLDQPLLVRYGKYMLGVCRLDFGTSWFGGEDIAKLFLGRLPFTLLVAVLSILFAVALGCPLGIGSAIKQYSLMDYGVSFVAMLLTSMPAFWLGLVLLLVFSVKLGWFPVGFSTPIGMLDSEVSGWQRLHHLALPALTLSLMSFSNIALHTRQKMIDVMNSPYILFARARGESGWTLFVRHGLRNTILPALTLQFASFAELFGGSVLAENVFSYPGLGSAVSAAGLNSDVPLLLGITLFSTLFVCVGNMIANLLYGVIDPKMRNGEE